VYKTLIQVDQSFVQSIEVAQAADNCPTDSFPAAAARQSAAPAPDAMREFSRTPEARFVRAKFAQFASIDFLPSARLALSCPHPKLIA
jgi:hypothetical protein